MTDELELLEEQYEVDDNEPWMVNIELFCNLLSKFSSKQCNIMAHILRNTDEDNIFIGTIKEISQATGISVPTVNKVMKKFTENEFLKREKNYKWIVNRHIIDFSDEEV